MLVLTRKPLETVLIGDAIRVTLLAIRGNHIRLGIEAPGDVKIVRAELCRQVEPSIKDSATTTALVPK